MERKTKQEVDYVVKNTHIVEKILSHICCFLIFGAIGVFLMLQFNTFWGYLGCAVCAMIVVTTIFNTITNISIMSKLKHGNFKYIKEKLIDIAPCSSIIPGRADYLQANTKSCHFFINKFNNTNFQIGDIIEAVFIGNENVPFHLAKIDSEQNNSDKVTQNQNKGFFTPMILPLLIILIIIILTIVYPFLK